MSLSPRLWVHADALSKAHPVFEAAPHDAEPIYVWDAQDVAQRQWSLKRCVFVLECLADMDVSIIEGRPEDVLRGRDIYLAASVDPYIRGIISQLGPRAHVIADRPFAELPDDADMGRFFRYWNRVRSSAMRRTNTVAEIGPGDQS